jgi:U3 small nucleolar RNA-associated protein 18
MNGTARSLCFSPDSRHLVGSGGDAEVYTWDLRASSQALVGKFANEGGLPTCALATDGRHVACASEAGVVNLYALGLGGFPGPAATGAPMKPWKALLNLTTPVETMKFSHDGAMLALASRWTKNACRLVHVRSGTVFSNWPTSKSPLNYVFRWRLFAYARAIVRLPFWFVHPSLRQSRS